MKNEFFFLLNFYVLYLLNVVLKTKYTFIPQYPNWLVNRLPVIKFIQLSYSL